MFGYTFFLIDLIYSLDDSEFSFYGLTNISDSFYGIN